MIAHVCIRVWLMKGLSMSIKIGTAPVSWGILEFEGWVWPRTADNVLDEMVQAGFSGTELGPYGFLPTRPDALRRELSSRNLVLLGAFTPLPLADEGRHLAALDSALDVARLLADAGAPVLVLADIMDERRMQIAGSATKADGMSDEQWKRAADLVNRVAAKIASLGLRCAFHHHGGTFVETPEELDRLLQLTDPSLVGICLDTGHYFYGGGDPVQCVRQNNGRIWHVHLKDVRSTVLATVRANRIHYMEAVRQGLFCPLGDGDVDLPGVLSGLHASGFEGWGVFEQDIDPEQENTDPLYSAARSRSYLRTAAGV